MSTPAEANRKGGRWGHAVVISVFFVSSVTFAFIMWWNSAVGRQWRNMRAAQHHLDGPLASVVFQAQRMGARFTVLTSEVIYVDGGLPSRADFDLLREQVRASHPAWPVHYRVYFSNGEGAFEADPVQGQ